MIYKKELFIVLFISLASTLILPVYAKKPDNPGKPMAEYTITFEGNIAGEVIATGSESRKGIFCRANAAGGYPHVPILTLSEVPERYCDKHKGFDFQLETRGEEVQLMFKWEADETITLLVDDSEATIYEGSIRGKKTPSAWNGPITFTFEITENE